MHKLAAALAALIAVLGLTIPAAATQPGDTVTWTTCSSGSDSWVLYVYYRFSSQTSQVYIDEIDVDHSGPNNGNVQLVVYQNGVVHYNGTWLVHYDRPFVPTFQLQYPTVRVREQTPIGACNLVVQIPI